MPTKTETLVRDLTMVGLSRLPQVERAAVEALFESMKAGETPKDTSLLDITPSALVQAMGAVETARVVEQAPHAVAQALKVGHGYAAGWGNTDADPSFAVLVVTGPAADKLRPSLDALRDLAREFS